MRRLHLCVIASLLALVLSSCGTGGGSPSPTPSSLKTFRSDEHGFSIAWDASETHVAEQGDVADGQWQLNLENVADSGQSVNGQDVPFDGILEVRVVKLETPVPQSSVNKEMADYLSKTLVQQARQQWKVVKKVEPYELVSVGGVPFLRASFMSRSELPFWVHNEVFVTSNGSRAFTIHLSADQDAWDQYEGQALRRILDSFRLL